MILRDAIDRDGFAIIPNVLPSGEVEQILEQICASAPRRTRAGVRHALRLGPVSQVAQQPNLIQLAQVVLGPEAFPFRATLFDKSPKSNWLVVWHQDTALPLRERHQVVGWGPWSVKDGVHYAHAPAAVLSQVLVLRIQLDRSTTLNGPLRVLPGTQTLGVLDDDRIHDAFGDHQSGGMSGFGGRNSRDEAITDSFIFKITGRGGPTSSAYRVRSVLVDCSTSEFGRHLNPFRPSRFSEHRLVRIERSSNPIQRLKR